MISNLRHQLSRVGMAHKIDQTLEEAAQVRADFGYPIMVTPLSQFVASQATLNVMMGERYRQVSDEIIQFALGYWGAEAAMDMDAGVKDRILERPRAKELARLRPPEPSIGEVRKRLGGPNLSDDELILRFISPESEIAAMRAAGPPKEHIGAGSPVLDLVKELIKRRELRAIDVRMGTTSISLRAQSGPRPEGES